jgi:Cu-processing system permease protein
MKTALIISRLTFFEASRRKVLWAALLLGVLFLIVFGLGFHFAQLDIQASLHRQARMSRLATYQMYNFLALAGLYAVNFLTIAMSILTSVDTLSGEVASGTIQTLVTKPIRRWEIVVGKWLGLGSMLTLYLLLMAGGTVGAVYVTAGYIVPNALQGVFLLWLNAMLLLSVSLWGGSFLSTLANGVVAFGLFGIAFVGGWVEHVGAFLSNRVAINIGIVSSLMIPSEALWRRAAHLMQSPLVTAMGVSPFTSSSVPSPLLVWYALLYTAAMLALAVHQFDRRDL